MAKVQLRNLTKRYGDFVAVDDFSLDVADGEFVALLGPSGCGKTTTLRMIAGFVEASTGEIRIGERDVTEYPPYRRNTGMVFQGYALFPHMTVFENVAFGLRMRRLGAAETHERVAQALKLVRLDGHVDRMPRQLSGGQQQRVALARALVVQPDVFLLDEPLSNLDAKLRQEVRLEIRQLQQALGLTTIFVTHDQEEALTMADRLVVMDRGAIQQVGSPAELYDRPVNRFVADFIGHSNFFNGRVCGPGEFKMDTGAIVRFDPEAATPQGDVSVAVRPERISFGHSPAAGTINCFEAEIEAVTFAGPRLDLILRCEGDRIIAHVHNSDGNVATERHHVGEQGFAMWSPSSTRLVSR
ncbi:ABC transporter ATP-binding protein [bacterium]|nr:MAG: ABC transporter ATP-binding protein [bacterium]